MYKFLLFIKLSMVTLSCPYIVLHSSLLLKIPPILWSIEEPVDQTTALPTCIMTQCQCQCQQSEVCPSCSASTVQASVVTAIVTALLVTVVSVVIQIAICKFHRKLRSGGVGVLAGGEGQVYEEVGGDEGGVAVVGGEKVRDPTYMEVGDGGGKTFQLKEYGRR